MTGSTTTTHKMSLPALSALVIGSMVGAGIFSLPRTFAAATGPFGAMIAWAIAGGGMFTLARMFQLLAERKPELDAGVYAYAKEGFGHYPGFLSAFGYWMGSCIGNVSYWVLIKSTLGAFLPSFGDGNTLEAIVSASIGIWIFHFLILRGVQQAAALNTIVTIAKIIPILTFIVLLIAAFRADLFAANFWGGRGMPKASLLQQVSATMLVTVFVFLGIEGASVYSRYARVRSDVGRATLIGFMSVTSLMVLVTLLPFAVLERAEIAGMRQPSLGAVLEMVVGPWGAVFVAIGLIISVLGAYLAWSLICAEVLSAAARTGDMPAVFARENRNRVPAAALWLTNGIVQLFIITTYWSTDAFGLMLSLTSAMALIPFFLVAAYGLQLSWRGETYDVRPEERGRDLLIAATASIYTLFLVYAGGLKFVLLSAILYAPGTILYAWARREHGRRVFTRIDWVVFAVAAAACLIGIHGLATQSISI